jgi:hypothetical protein
MKRKFLTNTYLRGVDNYILMQLEDEALDCYCVIKKVNSIDKPYISTHTGKDVCLLKEGYYMVEYLPKNGNYGVRVFLNDEKDTVSYYIDVINDIGIDYEKGLYYDDLYLDITIDKAGGDIIKVWDEDELQEALDTEDITKEQYEKAYETLKDLLNQIANNENKYINNDHKAYIIEKFK